MIRPMILGCMLGLCVTGNAMAQQVIGGTLRPEA